jgi:site-specific DNA-methyltransferase (adenine-specific)
MEPYYQDESVTIYHGDCRDILPSLPKVDLVLTDPPYGAETHDGARTNGGDDLLVDFAPIAMSDVYGLFDALSPLCERWFVATMEWRHIARLESAPPEDWRFVRFGVWVKPNGMPQYSGDRPAMGWEGIAFLHRDNGRMRWNGGGRHSTFIENKENTQHPTGKPLSLFRQFVALFSDTGDVVLDPFMGSGTTIRAAKDLGRKAIGIEIEERYCEIAANRCRQMVLI